MTRSDKQLQRQLEHIEQSIEAGERPADSLKTLRAAIAVLAERNRVMADYRAAKVRKRQRRLLVVGTAGMAAA